MKIVQPITQKYIFSIAAIAFLFFIIFSLGSCARKLTFGISPVVPAATGLVKIKRSKNDTYSIDVKVKNLAQPQRLSPPRGVYVVWIQSDRNAPENIGILKSSTDFLSSVLKGEMKATSTIKPNTVFITAEDNGNARYPGNQVVLRTQ